MNDDTISRRMTNTEAIETLRANYPDACFEQLREAVDAAIVALKAQNTSGDTISRQAAIDALDGEFTITGRENAETIRDYVNGVNKKLRELPSAERRGRWIYNTNCAEPPFKCSACGKSQGRLSNYCPNCGAKMVEK